MMKTDKQIIDAVARKLEGYPKGASIFFQDERGMGAVATFKRVNDIVPFAMLCERDGIPWHPVAYTSELLSIGEETPPEQKITRAKKDTKRTRKPCR